MKIYEPSELEKMPVEILADLAEALNIYSIATQVRNNKMAKERLIIHILTRQESMLKVAKLHGISLDHKGSHLTKQEIQNEILHRLDDPGFYKITLMQAEQYERRLATTGMYDNKTGVDPDELNVLIDPGTAPKEEIASVLSDLSRLYRSMGGSGITFSYNDVMIKEEELA